MNESPCYILQCVPYATDRRVNKLIVKKSPRRLGEIKDMTLRNCGNREELTARSQEVEGGGKTKHGVVL